MIVVCSTETSATIHWSPNPWPVSPNVLQCGICGTMWLQRTSKQGPGSMVPVQIFICLFACPMNPLTPHLATQWGEECSGVNVVPLVSVLQTRSSWMFVFKLWCSQAIEGAFNNAYLAVDVSHTLPHGENTQWWVIIVLKHIYSPTSVIQRYRDRHLSGQTGGSLRNVNGMYLSDSVRECPVGHTKFCNISVWWPCKKGMKLCSVVMLLWEGNIKQ